MSPHPHAMLVALDDSDASRRVLPAVAARAQEREDLRLVLCHVVPPLPPALLETPGAEHPDDERRMEAGQERAQDEWTHEHRTRGERLVAAGRHELETRGVPHARIETDVTGPAETHANLADVVLERARALDCDAVAVGRHSYPALRELLHTHLADEMERRAGELDVWVVDE